MGVEYSNVNLTKALDKMLPHLTFDGVFVKLCCKFVSVDGRICCCVVNKGDECGFF